MQTAAIIAAPRGGSLKGFYAPVRRCASAHALVLRIVR